MLSDRGAAIVKGMRLSEFPDISCTAVELSAGTPTLVTYWPAVAFRMTSHCISMSKEFTVSRGTDCRGGDRMKCASSCLQKKQESFFVHPPHQPQVNILSKVSAMFDSNRGRLTGSLGSTWSNSAYCTTISSCSVGTTNWFETYFSTILQEAIYYSFRFSANFWRNAARMGEFTEFFFLAWT